ncbi:MAG: ketopantoate reductase family protein [Halobacteriales archaeon]
MDVVVFGAGSLGSLVGGLLARVHDVTLVGRDPHMAAVASDGLRVTGVEAFTVYPATTTDGTGLRADLAVVTVKAFDTGTAAAELATGSFDAALSLQNGMGNEAVLADALDCAVLAGTTTHGALQRDPGAVEWTGRGETVIGPWDPPELGPAEAAAEAFDAAGIAVTVDADVEGRLWEKLAVNAAINPVTALARVENGALRDGPAGRVARAAARETAAVAQAEGVDLEESAAVDRAESVMAATAANRSSMLQDVAADQRTEIDAIAGYVVDRAEAHGVPVPVNRALSGLVAAWEAGRGLR